MGLWVITHDSRLTKFVRMLAARAASSIMPKMMSINLAVVKSTWLF